MTEPETNDQPTTEAGSDAKKTASTPPPSGSPASGAASAAGSAATGNDEAAVEFAEPEVAPDPLDVAKAEAAKYREQLLRTAADFENFRKRSRREQEDATKRGTEKALKELLPVFDNLERATASAATAPDVKSVADGLKMIGRQFTNTLEKLGIKRIEAVGKAFDPSLHEAIQHVDSEHPAGVIAVEVQAGYMLGEYLLRAALVAVSKGPAAAAEAPAPAAEAPSTTEEAKDKAETTGDA